MKLPEIRREKLRELMKKHTASGLAQMLGYHHSSFLSQMAGPNPTREVTEKTARRFETQLGLEVGYLDEYVDQAAAAPRSDESTVALVASVIRAVGAACDAEKVSLQPAKFADVVALAYLDAVEHSGQLRPEYFSQIVRLLK